MKLPAYFRSLAARFFHRSQTENELEEELRSHIKLRADDLERVGLTRADAERRADRIRDQAPCRAGADRVVETRAMLDGIIVA